MPSPSYSKAKGRTWENEIAEYFTANGFPMKRRVRAGAKDEGDELLLSDPTFVIEAKNEKKITLSTYVDELEVEIKNAKGKRGVVIVKRPRKPVDKAYVVMPLDLFIREYMKK